MFSEYEASSIQIVKSIHNNSLDAWSNNDSPILTEFFNLMTTNSSLLKVLGYVSDEIPPNYKNLCNS
ncbi:unnamed protein product [Schistosoma margrebowiei]|uniref:Uncharacterized protein n=1 Tax=Schistosoma margrebowiei TaxID=48269 RepID=A0A183MA90_9TREM|nr:unnamed protein product [Schistosoma margrebowiei]